MWSAVAVKFARGLTTDAPVGAVPTAGPGWVEAVLRADGRGILRLLWRILGDADDVSDAFQECFCRLAGYPKAASLGNARAFAYRTASNIAIELIRVRKRRLNHWPRVVSERAERAESAGISPTADHEQLRIDDDRLRSAIALLPHHLRGVITLRDLAQMSYEEVGQILGIGAATARVYRRHGIVRLAELMRADGSQEQEGDA